MPVNSFPRCTDPMAATSENSHKPAQRGTLRAVLAGAAVLAVLGAVTAHGDDKRFPGIKRLMSVAEFEETGLEKLSDEELKALDQWLVRYTAGDAEVLQQTNEEVREAVQDHEVFARIEGEFTGWSGETIFRLDNGQIWEQRLDGKYFYKGPPNPEIKIDRNWLGFYRLTVIETGKSIGVSPRR